MIIGHGHNNFEVPQTGTIACQEFYRTFIRIDSFFHWVLFMASYLDNRKEADDELYKVVDEIKMELPQKFDLGKKQEIEERRPKWKPMKDIVKENRQFFLETMLISHVNNYLNYLSSLLFEIFTQRQETLKSSEKIDIETVLNCESIGDVVKVFAEKKVEELSFGSINELYDFFKHRFKLELFSDNLQQKVIEAVETRNISVHNRCIINRRYIKKTGCDPRLIGSRKQLMISELDEYIAIFLESVRAVDQDACQKFRIQEHPLKLDISTNDDSSLTNNTSSR